jgi:hypothetical protein
MSGIPLMTTAIQAGAVGNISDIRDNLERAYDYFD